MHSLLLLSLYHPLAFSNLESITESLDFINCANWLRDWQIWYVTAMQVVLPCTSWQSMSCSSCSS
jgi:hypothetical protein